MHKQKNDMSFFHHSFRAQLRIAIALAGFFLLAGTAWGQGTRLLRQPAISGNHIAFIYGSDLWIVSKGGGDARRLTSTPAVESNPHFSPDGRHIAFSSNRSGSDAVYVLPVEGGTPTRLTWHPAPALARGWTPDGKNILYASSRETAPTGFTRLWTVPVQGGPSALLPSPRGFRGAYDAAGKRMIVEPVNRWDVEWRAYRGGQNTPLVILDLDDLSETLLPNERSTDIHPVWMGETVYFLSDRDWASNIWAYTPATKALRQLTRFTGAEVKWMGAGGGLLVFEREGYLHTIDPVSGISKQLEIHVSGDFPWAETRREDVSGRVAEASLSPTGKRALMEARGEIFTVPVENGNARNLTRSAGAADRAPVWSPDGGKVAWFSDAGGEGYKLMIGDQDGLSAPRSISIGESKMAWEPAWSPDGKHIAFVDDKVRVRILEIQSGKITTADVGGVNIERGNMGLSWSPDSKWLAYSRTASNNFRRITLWSAESGKAQALTDPMADAFSPAWDLGGRYLYFLASTDVALGSGWANTSSIQADPTHGAYVVVLRKDDPTPFPPKSDEEAEKKEPEAAADDKKDAAGDKPAKADAKSAKKDQTPEKKEEEKPAVEPVRIDWDGIGRRTLALPVPVRSYALLAAGPKGSVFIGERVRNAPGLTLHKFTIEGKKTEEFTKGVQRISVSANGEKMLFQSAGKWRVVSTAKPPSGTEGMLAVSLRMELDRLAEWQQIFDEAWRYERDYFYDPNHHGRNWQEVRERYAPLIPFVRHRSDLSYVLDQMNGELSVGHSFVFGGDLPAVDTSQVGLPGADLAPENGRWRIKRIFTAESWNPGLSAPLDRPGLKVQEGHYILAVDGAEFSASDDPFRAFDGTAGRQTVLHINDKPSMEGAWKITVEPVRNDNGLRQRAWVEDNRRKVEELSDGKLAYVWVPNTGGPGFVSFNRYYFAQQDKQGAVIDERFNGGGLLDDYMVDLMTRRLRAAITNEAPGGAPFRLPAGILGPKVLLINELAGSGGDFFPWVFRQQKAGPLIGARTWGGLVKSSVHYALVDGGALTAPDNAVFDPINNRWIGENEGIAPDIEVRLDARSIAEGRDVQLERAVQEALRLLQQEGSRQVAPPPFPRPAIAPVKD